MYFGSSSGVKMFQDQGINTTFLAILSGERRKVADDYTIFPGGFKP